MKEKRHLIGLLLLLALGLIAWKGGGQVTPTYTVKWQDISAASINNPPITIGQWSDCPAPAEATAGGLIYISRPNGGSIIRDLHPLVQVENIRNP